MSIPIIDTHVHIWDLIKVHYSWLQGDTSILARNYLPDELYPQLSKVNVTNAVLVQAANNTADTELMLNAATHHDWIKGVVGWVPLEDPKKTQALIEDWKATNTYLKGIRHLIHNEANDHWLLQDNVIESLKILAHHHITYDIVGVKEAHLKAAITIAEKIPNLNNLEALKISFNYSILYESTDKKPTQQAKVSFEGSLIFDIEKEQAQKFIKSWKKKEEIDGLKVAVLNILLKSVL
jgi:predicted TIM-barrel fold metal-dependent hydrolase